MKDPKDRIRRREDVATPVIGVGDSAWVRPGELLVESNAEKDLERMLRERGGAPYDPREQKDDWRRDREAPVYGDINHRLERAGLKLRLWVGFSIDDQLELIGDGKLRGLHFNHVFFGEDFYQGGPGGLPAAVLGPGMALSWAGNQQVDVAVLDTGVPEDWSHVHPELKNSVHQVGVGRVTTDPLDEDDNNILDEQAGHGLFICGLIARMASGLDIQLSRVMSSTGETDDSLLSPALSESTAPVINLSLGGYTVNDQEPAALGPILRALVASGRVIVAAAGNAGSIDAKSAHHGRPFWPATMDEVISVGALDTTCDDEPKVWATEDPNKGSNPAKVYAPGVDLLSTYVAGWPPFDGWARWTGTSFAAPLVAAALAQQLVAPHTGTTAQVVQQWIDDLNDHTWPNVPAGKIYLPPQPPTNW